MILTPESTEEYSPIPPFKQKEIGVSVHILGIAVAVFKKLNP
jgi:hypothetical protein